ncbi:hypothetical protein EDB85DRAFT_2150976 [Lactarius pseudohatsudake]|nr:hypothetical protein EDB85DRAFT_2150976 [Lactarius pseudohatsudake]
MGHGWCDIQLHSPSKPICLLATNIFPSHFPASHVSNKAAVVGAPSDSQDRIPRKQDHKSSRATINFTDGSDFLFSMYNEKTYESDSKLIQNWREDANGLMLLSGLVSATVAGFVSQSYFASRTSSQDVSAFYLAQIYQLQVSLNSSLISSELSPPTPAATPELSHFLWFTSLTISLGCSVGATLAQNGDHALCSTESAIFKSVDFVLLADQYANDDPTTRSLAMYIIAVAINRLEDYQPDERWAGIIQRSVKLGNLVQLAWELYAAHPGSDS